MDLDLSMMTLLILIQGLGNVYLGDVWFIFIGPFGEVVVILNMEFSNLSSDLYLEYFLWKCPCVDASELHWWWVNIG